MLRYPLEGAETPGGGNDHAAGDVRAVDFDVEASMLRVSGKTGVLRRPQSGDDAVILVHNHPSGDPTPSRADIEMTKAIVEVARSLGIAVHDHLIVGKDGHASLKGLRLI